MPVGKKSQNGTLSEFNVLITADEQPIATVNHYVDEESMQLAPVQPVVPVQPVTPVAPVVQPQPAIITSSNVIV
jgi:hypothetical protein